MRSSVDLPVPLIPTMPRRSPLATVTETSSSSGRPGRVMDTRSASIRITPGGYRPPAHRRISAQGSVASKGLLVRPFEARFRTTARGLGEPGLPVGPRHQPAPLAAAEGVEVDGLDLRELEQGRLELIAVGDATMALVEKLLIGAASKS